MANTLQKTKPKEMEVSFKYENEDITLTPSIVKRFLVSNAQVNITDQEFMMFASLCKFRKLNPFLKEAYIIKYGNEPATIVVGKDAILKRAISNPNFNGREQGIIVVNANNEIEERRGTFKLSNEKLVGGWAKVYRKDWEYPTYTTVSFDEVAQHKRDGSLNSNWATKGATMVEKVALVRALRETFAEELGGIIDEDEAWDNSEVKSKQVANNYVQIKQEQAQAELINELGVVEVDSIEDVPELEINNLDSLASSAPF